MKSDYDEGNESKGSNDNEKAQANENENLTGGAIGDTICGEQFALKLLFKLSNLETIKTELADESVEEDFCLLWDSAINRDVVIFLLKYDALNLFKFAWPAIESPRMMEIVIGIIGNMCCQQETVDQLMKDYDLLSCLVYCITSEDSLILIQLMRLINSSLCLSDEHLETWMKIFIEVEYSTGLYYILKSSVKKDVLATAIENFNTICEKCNVEQTRIEFFEQFVKPSAMEGLSTAFTEIYSNHRDSFFRNEFERFILIVVQISMNLVGFEYCLEIYHNNKVDILGIIAFIFTYYKIKFVNEKEIDLDFIDLLDSIKTIVKRLQLSSACDFDCFCLESCEIWKVLHMLIVEDNDSNYDIEDAIEIKSLCAKITNSLGELIFIYLEVCSDENLFKILDEIGSSYKSILRSVNNSELVTSVSMRICDSTTKQKLEMKD